MTGIHITIESAATLSLRDRQLVILLPDGEERTIPVEDIASVMIESQEATVTMPALNALTENNVSVIFCDARHSPASMLLTLHANAVQTERFRTQLSLPEERKEALWAQIAYSKIRRQADLLDLLSLDGQAVRKYVGQIEPIGGASSVEGVAAREYWMVLFGKDFRRERFGSGPNPMLNYGYTILRSAMTRALMSHGLFPCQGLHHKNRYSDMPLADDVMEPYRTAVDLEVYSLWHDGRREVDRDVKTALRKVLIGECSIKGFSQSLSDAMSITASSLLDCIEDRKEAIIFPD